MIAASLTDERAFALDQLGCVDDVDTVEHNRQKSFSLTARIILDNVRSRKGAKAFPFLMLHAQEIAFRLLTGEEVTIEASIPESFKVVIESLRETNKL